MMINGRNEPGSIIAPDASSNLDNNLIANGAEHTMKSEQKMTDLSTQTTSRERLNKQHCYYTHPWRRIE
jgi:hypothetical protein